jgi:hypothetical protein
MFEYGFTENTDYSVIKSENPVNQQVTIADFALTLNCAKEISMIQRSEKGKQARLYFIACEKELKEVTKPMSQLDILSTAINILKEQETRISAVENKLDAITLRLQEPAVIALLNIPTPSSRQKVEAIVAGYTKTTKGDYKENWNYLYSKLYLHYRVRIKSMTKEPKQSWLDVAEKAGQCDNLLTVAEKYFKI